MPAARLVDVDCPICEGLGSVHRIGDDGRKYSRKCECFERGKSAYLLARAGLPERYANCSLEEFETADPDKGAGDQKLGAKRAAELYLQRFEVQLGEGRLPAAGLLFVGPPGAGKTHLVAAVLTELVRRYSVRGRFVDFTHLLHDIQVSFDPRTSETRGDILDPVIDADVLVIDELGAQKPTPFVQSMLYEVINNRYTARRPTIFTTNYLPDVLTGDASSVEPNLAATRAAPVRRSGPAKPDLWSWTAAAQMDEQRKVPERRAEVRREVVEVSSFERLSSRVGPLILSRLYEMAQIVSLTAVSDHREKSQGSVRRGKR